MESLISAISFGISVVVGYVGCMQHQQQCDKRNDVANNATTTSSALHSLSSVSLEASSSSRLVRHLSTNSKWSEYSDEEESFIQDFPKVELHVHLDGSFDAEYLWNYLKEHPESVYCLPVKVTPPWDPTRSLDIRSKVMNCRTSQDYHKLCTCRGYRSLNEMLNCFEVFLPLVRGNISLIEQLAYDFCQRQWEQNVVYCEVRYSPHLLAEAFTNDGSADIDHNQAKNSRAKLITGTSITPDAVFEAVTRGLRRGCDKYTNLTINQILCCITWRPDWAASTLDMATMHQNAFPCAVVGVDIAAGEEHFNRQQFPDLFGPHFTMAQEAKKRHVPLTLHAGEVPTEEARENIRRAILEYGACRIGHGYRMAESVETMNLVRNNNVHVEVCPTSSVETGGWVYDENDESRDWKNHPATIMSRHGVSLCLNSDDPAVFHTSLSWQYRIALAKMLLSRKALVEMNLEAVKAAWCSVEEKDRVTKLIRCYGHVKGIEVYEDCQCDTIMHNSHFSWWKSKTDSFLDRVYLRDENINEEQRV